MPLPRLWYAPLTLFALQTAPVGVTMDSAGNVRLTFGGGLGSYQERIVSCSGETLDSYMVPFQTVGGQADVWTSSTLRITGYGGAMFASPDRPASDLFSPPYEGGYGGAVIAGEWRHVGIGTGVGFLPDPTGDPQDTKVYPALYLRLGTLDRAHFRLDLFGPPAPGAPPDLTRFGVGFGQGHQRRIGGFAGLGLAAFPTDNPDLALLGDILVPVSRGLDVGGTGAVRFGEGNGVGFNIGVMLRAQLGRPPR